jgi:hypothetical protein
MAQTVFISRLRVHGYRLLQGVHDDDDDVEAGDNVDDDVVTDCLVVLVLLWCNKGSFP